MVKLLETLPLVALEALSTEVTVSWARPLSLAAPLLSYRNKLRHFSKMVVASKLSSTHKTTIFKLQYNIKDIAVIMEQNLVVLP